MAVFRRSCYVRGPHGKIICILDRHLDDGPFNLRVDLPPSCDMQALGIAVGMPLYANEQFLCLAGKILFTLDGAKRWVPPALPALAPLVQVRTRLRALATELKQRIPYDGLGPLIPHIEDLALGRSVTLDGHNRVAKAALPAVEALVEGSTRWDASRMDAGVGSLVGLGPGLTPSGDDLLAGMMVALWATVRAENAARELNWYQRPPELRPGIVDILGEYVKSHGVDGTNLISCAILEHAASGTSSAAIHELLGVLLQTRAQARILESALDVAKTGHTSGWDSLAGVLLGVHLGLGQIAEVTDHYAQLCPQPSTRTGAVW